MKIPAIKKAVEDYTTEQLNLAEALLLEGEPLPFDVDGDDEGEQLTHIIAARDIRLQMEKEGLALKDAIRAYTQRVRNSIS